MCCHGSKPPVAPTGPNSGPNKTAGGGAADGGSPPCPTHCTITSQTVATSPADRTRTRIGVGERSEEHTSELQSRPHLVCRLLLEKKKKITLRQLSKTSIARSHSAPPASWSR